mgnify:CR=1 FL=1
MEDDQFYKVIILCFGSWWSLLIHALVFAIILVVSSDLLFFTTFLSIEAIFIGVVILMATNREQVVVDKRTAERRIRDRELVREDVVMTHDVMEEIQTLKKHHITTAKALEEIKTLLQNTTPRG